MARLLWASGCSATGCRPNVPITHPSPPVAAQKSIWVKVPSHSCRTGYPELPNLHSSKAQRPNLIRFYRLHRPLMSIHSKTTARTHLSVKIGFLLYQIPSRTGKSVFRTATSGSTANGRLAGTGRPRRLPYQDTAMVRRSWPWLFNSR